MVKQLVVMTSALWEAAAVVQLNHTWSDTLLKTNNCELIFTVAQILTD